MGNHHKFDPKKLHKLRDPERLKRENPETIWKNLSLKNPNCILDIGGGIGFAAIPFAKKMPDGTVWVCDISIEMLATLKNEVEKAGVTNVKPLLIAEVDIPLPDSFADGILMQNLHHELKYPQNSLKECKRLLKPGGKIAIIDWKKEKMEFGPPFESRITEEEIENDLKSAGFSGIRKFNDLPYHSFLVATRPHMVPAFDFLTEEQKVLLRKGQTAEITIDSISYNGSGDVWLELLPSASIAIFGKFNNVPPSALFPVASGQKEISTFKVNGHNINGFLLDAGEGAQNQKEMIVKWQPRSEPIAGIGNEATPITEIVFHLFNFVNFRGTRLSKEIKENTFYAINHVDLVSDDWEVELLSFVETADNFKQLKAEGGYKLTHIGSVKKTDGNIFSGKDAAEIIKTIQFFLSFAKGGWCNPVCPVGYDAGGNRVWESWSSPAEHWQNLFSWFDPHHSQQLTNLWKGFTARWANNDWRETLKEVIYWYVSANQSSKGIDTGIILTQTAIERLSYEFCVNEKQLITVKGFKKLWASDKFRLLFSSLEIPLDISPKTLALQELAKQFNWLDAPHALTEVRNSLIHPEHKRRGQFNSAIYETWNLGLWYLEMATLAICM